MERSEERLKYDIDTRALEACRITKGFATRLELVNAAKINRNAYDKIVAGKQLPSAKVMYSLAESLGLTPEEAARIFFSK